VGTTRHHTSPYCLLARSPPSNTFWEEEHLWETLPPASLPPGCRPGWLNQSELIDIFVLPYVTIILLAHSKSVTIKKCEIKYEKNTILCGTSGAVDPAKRDFERTRIEPTMPNFRPGSKRALPAHSGRPIALPFWECGPPVLPPGSPFALRLWATRGSNGLALTGVRLTDIYLGSETIPGSSGAVPGTLTPGWQGGKPLTAAHTGEHTFILSIYRLG
jgi:hypothetical protein